MRSEVMRAAFTFLSRSGFTDRVKLSASDRPWARASLKSSGFFFRIWPIPLPCASVMSNVLSKQLPPMQQVGPVTVASLCAPYR